MHIGPQRNVEQVRSEIESWFRKRYSHSRIDVPTIGIPRTGGRTNDTFILEVNSKGALPYERLVLRIRPDRHQVFHDLKFEEQFRVLELLNERQVIPVPGVLCYEPDASLFGVPFYLMEAVDGQSPGDRPSYRIQGFVYDASKKERRSIWESAVRTLGDLHRFRFGSDELSFLDKDGNARSGLERQMVWWRDFLNWAAEGKTVPLAEKGWDYLISHPIKNPPTALSWGDSRLGNMIIKNFECAAVIDWELVSLGGGMQDLAYWLLYEYEFLPYPQLEGFGTRDETIALWEESSGHRADDLLWYEIFAALKLFAIIIRLCALRLRNGEPDPYQDYQWNNRCTHRLAHLLGLPAPGRLP